MRLRYAPLIGLPLHECEPHLQGILRKLEARGPAAAEVAEEVRVEVRRLRGQLARNDGPRVKRVREGDAFALVRADGARFHARRRLDQGEGWVLVGPHGLVLGNYRTLPDCEAAAARA